MPHRRSSLPMPMINRRGLLGSSLALAAAGPMLSKAALAQSGSVNVYNWDTYIGETTLDDFTEATGIRVRYDLFASNDELFGKLREGNPGYDVIVPSDSYVQRMIVAGMLQELDHSKIPNIKNIGPKFSNPGYDPALAHSVPYFWGTLGLGYRKGAADPTKLADIFESDAYAGRIALLSSLDSLRMALKFLGYSMNTESPAEIEEAAALLIKTKPKIKTFAPDTGQDLLLAGEVDVALEFSGDLLQVMEEDDELAYRVPEEGGQLWTDNMCVPTGAPNLENAHAFINFILTPEVHADIAEFIQYALPNAAARELLPEEQRNDETIYPPDSVLERCEFTIYKGEQVEALYENAWTRVLAA